MFHQAGTRPGRRCRSNGDIDLEGWQARRDLSFTGGNDALIIVDHKPMTLAQSVNFKVSFISSVGREIELFDMNGPVLNITKNDDDKLQ
jgi:hypothetical protein